MDYRSDRRHGACRFACDRLLLYLRDEENLEEVTTHEGTARTVLSVYVLEKDSALTLADTAGYSYGISSSSDSEAADRLLLTLGDLFGAEPDVAHFDTVFSLADALKDQKVGAVILEEAYAESIAEAKGYEWSRRGYEKWILFLLRKRKLHPASNLFRRKFLKFLRYISAELTRTRD